VGQHPTDRGQPGTKRRVLTDGGGVPIGLAVEGANRHDCKMTRETIASIPVKRPEPTPAIPQGLCLDTGDDDEDVRALLAECGCTAHSRARGEEAKALRQEAGFRARRWVVERTHSWRNRCRRVLIRWDKQVRNYVAFLHWACASITYRQSGLLG
jgi:putative transposase